MEKLMTLNNDDLNSEEIQQLLSSITSSIASLTATVEALIATVLDTTEKQDVFKEKYEEVKTYILNNLS